MRSTRCLAVLLIALTCALLPASAAPSDAETATTCAAVANVDSCWEAGVAAERRGDAAAALAAYDRSCSAGWTINGCYEVGKITFLNPNLRDYRLSRARMARVCGSDDIGMGPYGCTYLGIMQRDGLGGARQPREATLTFVRACFTHNTDHYLDGRGCAALADSLPDATTMGQSHISWPRAYIRYLAYAMGCTDGMPALCRKAGEVYRQSVAASAKWLAECEDQLQGRAPAGTCPRLADPKLSAAADQSHALRGSLANLFRVATDLPVWTTE
jgi:hypothetical protein